LSQNFFFEYLSLMSAQKRKRGPRPGAAKLAASTATAFIADLEEIHLFSNNGAGLLAFIEHQPTVFSAFEATLEALIAMEHRYNALQAKLEDIGPICECGGVY